MRPPTDTDAAPPADSPAADSSDAASGDAGDSDDAASGDADPGGAAPTDHPAPATDPPEESIRVLAGECTTTFSGRRERTQRGHVVVVVKPDKTVLVHDAEGYQPIAWLTRADAVTVEVDDPTGAADGAMGAGSGPEDAGANADPGADEAGFGVTARAGDQVLRVVSHRSAGWIRFPASTAGVPVGACPDCGSALVRTGGAVACLGCDREHGLPDGGQVLDAACDACGLPLVRVRRGAPIEVCLDRGCDPLAERVRDLYDRAWSCPDCDSDLRVIERGGLLLGCDAYPDCETAFSFPAGPVVGRCDCGLPVFRTGGGRRCLDGSCERFEAAGDGE